MVITAL